MKKILLLLVFLLAGCGATDLYKEEGFGFEKSDNLYSGKYRTCGTMVMFAKTSGDYPDLGYVTIIDGLQVYALLPNELDKSNFSMHGIYPIFPLPIPYIPWIWSSAKHNENRNVVLMMSFRAEGEADFTFNDKKVYIEKDGVKYFPKTFQGGYIKKSVRGRLFDYNNIEQFRDKKNNLFNITKMQEFKKLDCREGGATLCVCSSRNFVYGFEFDFKYADLENASLVIAGLEKDKKHLAEIKVPFKYSSGWLLRGMVGP